jgi:uncharacterized protein
MEVIVQTYRIPAAHRERVIRGKNNWWFLGPGGVARLRASHVADNGTLTASAESHLRESGLFTSEKPRVYTVTVLTSTDCNLGCGYCFQNTAQDPTGGNRPPRITHSRLTPDRITSILEFAGGRMAEVDLEKLHILLFGGEPLLNPRGCLELLARAADYGLVSASMISNGTLLTSTLAKQLVELKLRAIQITFDGDRADHDGIRVRRSGGGTFDSIVENMVSVSQAVAIRWGIRVNVSHHNHSGVEALIDALATRLDTSMCGIHFAWVGDSGIGYANQMRHSESLAEQFFRWQRHATEAGFRVSRPTASGPCVTCSFDDGKYGAVVNADGTLSSCWETAGRPGWQVGSVLDGYLPAVETAGKWISCEDSRRYADDGQPLSAFNDALDAAFLDYLDEAGRL